MTLTDVLTLVAILASPVVAVWVSRLMQDRRERRQQQQALLSALIANRGSGATPDLVRALNMIDLVFHDKDKVRRLWHEYYGMLSNRGLNNPTGWQRQKEKNTELVTEMARVLGYGKVISHLDTARVYSPIGPQQEQFEAREVRQELLRVLKSTGRVSTEPLDEGASDATGGEEA